MAFRTEARCDAVRVMLWLIAEGVCIRQLDRRYMLAFTRRLTPAVAALVRDRSTCQFLAHWIEFAGRRWPVSWAIASPEAQTWMAWRAMLYQGFTIAQREYQRVTAEAMQLEQGHGEELADFLAVGEVVRRFECLNEVCVITDASNILERSTGLPHAARDRGRHGRRGRGATATSTRVRSKTFN